MRDHCCESAVSQFAAIARRESVIIVPFIAAKARCEGYRCDSAESAAIAREKLVGVRRKKTVWTDMIELFGAIASAQRRTGLSSIFLCE